MTTDQRDPLLQSLFAEAEQDLAGEVLTAQVMERTRGMRYRLLAASAAAVLSALTVTWLLFGLPLFDFALLVSSGLATPLVDLGEGWLALLLLPINTVAGVLMILLKGLRMVQKKLFPAQWWG